MTQWGLDTLFNPAKRHMDEEKRRLQSTREEVGDSSGGKRIDLESGKVRIRRDDRGVPREEEDSAAELVDGAAAAAAEDAAAEDTAPEHSAPDATAAGAVEPGSPVTIAGSAAERAASRRRRAAK
jgi:hypothetical protein